MGGQRQISATFAATLMAVLVASCASRPSAHTSDGVDRAKVFMASYGTELRNGDRVALAARYHPDGSYAVGDGKKAYETHDQTAAFYLSEWQPPQAFEWQDLSFEPVGSGAIAVIGKFKWQGAGAAEGTIHSYSAVLVPVAGQLKIRVEDESGAE